MEATTVLKTATVLLAITAHGGRALACVRFARDAEPPAWLAMIHSVPAASAVTLLVRAAATAGARAVGAGAVRARGARRRDAQSGLPPEPQAGAQRPDRRARRPARDRLHHAGGGGVQAAARSVRSGS